MNSVEGRASFRSSRPRCATSLQILLLGEITCHARGARDVAALEARIEALKRPDNALRTLVLEWTDPPMSAGHWIPELVEFAGGEPVLANPGTNSQRLEWTAIAASPTGGRHRCTLRLRSRGDTTGDRRARWDRVLEIAGRATQRSCPCAGRQCVSQPAGTSVGRFSRDRRAVVY